MKIFKRTIFIFMWVPIYMGLNVLVMNLYASYMVWSGQVEAGAEVFYDIAGPSPMDTLWSVAIGCWLVVFGFAVRASISRSLKGKSAPQNGSLNT